MIVQVIRNIFPSLSIAYSTRKDGDVFDRKDVMRSVKKIRKKFKHIIVPKLQHGSKSEVGNIQMNEPLCDAIILPTTEIAITMRLADCLPVVLFDPKQRVAALIHGGWRSLLQNIIPLTIQRMQIEFHVNPSNTYAWIGPSLRSCCNVVHPPIVQGYFSEWKQYITSSSKGIMVDLQHAAIKHFLDNGLLREHIIDSELCTYHNEEFYSFRKQSESSMISDGERYSHFMVMMWMENA